MRAWKADFSPQSAFHITIMELEKNALMDDQCATSETPLAACESCEYKTLLKRRLRSRWHNDIPSAWRYSCMVVLTSFVLLACVNVGFLLGEYVYSRKHIQSTWNADFAWVKEGVGAAAEVESRRFKAPLYARNEYRGPPSPAIDAAWDRFTTNPWMVETAVVMNVSHQEAIDSQNGQSFETIVQLDEENGGGLMGSIELFHQMHCLNMLRKWTYMDYYIDKDVFFQIRPDRRREHADHCIDVIRQALMCRGDMGLILFHWVHGIQAATPDFNTMHQCRDPEAILKWAKTRTAPITHAIERKPGDPEAEKPF